MFRLLKALPLTLALAALFLFTGCGSSSSQARFVNAIPDAGVLDIDVGGTKEFSSVAFATASGSNYVGVPSGSVTIEGFASGTTTEAFTTSGVSLNSGSEYTLVAVGFLTGSVIVLNPVDNNTEPADGMVSFRVINASPSGGTVDVYILPNPISCQLGTQPGDCAPTIPALAYQSTSTYATQSFNSNGQNFTLIVTTSGNTTPIFSFPLPSVGSSSLGSIRTLVLTDNSSGTAINDEPIVLDDLN